jgi:penicillin amidase
MKETITFLRGQLGDETYNWRWESLHTLTLEPLLFSQAAKQQDAPEILKMIVSNVLNRGPYGVPGNGTTVNNAQYSWKEPFTMVLGLSIRRIVDLSDLRSSKSVIPGGQSGIALTKDYNNQTELWLTGKHKTLIQHFNELNTEEMELLLFIPKSHD